MEVAVAVLVVLMVLLVGALVRSRRHAARDDQPRGRGRRSSRELELEAEITASQDRAELA